MVSREKHARMTGFAGRSLNSRVLVAISLFLASAAIFLWRHHIVQQRARVPLQIPLSATEEYSPPARFEADMACAYIVGFDRPMKDVRTEFSHSACEDYDVDFYIKGDRQVVARGSNNTHDSSIVAGRTTVFCYVGQFNATPGKQYEFSFRAKTRTPTQDVRGSTISISPGCAESRNVFDTWLWWLAAFGLAVVGIVVASVQREEGAGSER